MHTKLNSDGFSWGILADGAILIEAKWRKLAERRLESAPDLLLACKEAKPALNAAPCTCNKDRDCQRCHALRKIKEAISLAEKGE